MFEFKTTDLIAKIDAIVYATDSQSVCLFLKKLIVVFFSKLNLTSPDMNEEKQTVKMKLKLEGLLDGEILSEEINKEGKQFVELMDSWKKTNYFRTGRINLKYDVKDRIDLEWTVVDCKFY